MSGGHHARRFLCRQTFQQAAEGVVHTLLSHCVAITAELHAWCFYLVSYRPTKIDCAHRLARYSTTRAGNAGGGNGNVSATVRQCTKAHSRSCFSADSTMLYQ